MASIRFVGELPNYFCDFGAIALDVNPGHALEAVVSSAV